MWSLVIPITLLVLVTRRRAMDRLGVAGALETHKGGVLVEECWWASRWR